MSESTVAIHMPDLLYQRLQRLAALTQRPLESLVLQALDANIPPLLEDMPEHMGPIWLRLKSSMMGRFGALPKEAGVRNRGRDTPLC